MRPSWDELAEHVHVVRLPMRVRFRGLIEREVLLLRGPAGWGEFGPFVEYDDAEAARWLAGAIESAWTGAPAPVRTVVPVNATVPAVPADQVSAVLAGFPGCTSAKVKVGEPGQSLADDVARVAEVRSLLGGSGRIRVDANGAWDVAAALDALSALSRYGLEYAEQPCASLADLRRLRLALARAGVDVAVAADESIRKAEDPLRVAVFGAADIVVLKVAPLGGVHSALRVAEQCGLPVVVSSALDTSVGIAAGVALAAALPQLPFACGLGTAALFTRDIVADPLLPVDGAIQVARASGVTADPRALEQLAAPRDRQRWWRARLARCYALLGA